MIYCATLNLPKIEFCKHRVLAFSFRFSARLEELSISSQFGAKIMVVVRLVAPFSVWLSGSQRSNKESGNKSRRGICQEVGQKHAVSLLNKHTQWVS